MIQALPGSVKTVMDGLKHSLTQSRLQVPSVPSRVPSLKITVTCLGKLKQSYLNSSAIGLFIKQLNRIELGHCSKALLNSVFWIPKGCEIHRPAQRIKSLCVYKMANPYDPGI